MSTAATNGMSTTVGFAPFVNVSVEICNALKSSVDAVVLSESLRIREIGKTRARESNTKEEKKTPLMGKQLKQERLLVFYHEHR